MKDAPCPFCGSLLGGSYADHRYYVWGCCDCHAKGPRASSVHQARQLWNTRLSNTAASDVAEAEVARQAEQERDAREADTAYCESYEAYGFRS